MKKHSLVSYDEKTFLKHFSINYLCQKTPPTASGALAPPLPARRAGAAPRRVAHRVSGMSKGRRKKEASASGGGGAWLLAAGSAVCAAVVAYLLAPSLLGETAASAADARLAHHVGAEWRGAYAECIRTGRARWAMPPPLQRRTAGCTVRAPLKRRRLNPRG